MWLASHPGPKIWRAGLSGLEGSYVAGNVFNGNFFSLKGSKKAGSSIVGNAGSCGRDIGKLEPGCWLRRKN